MVFKCLNLPCILIFKEVERIHNINLDSGYKLWYPADSFLFPRGFLENLSTLEYYRNKNIIETRLSDTLVVLFTVLDWQLIILRYFFLISVLPSLFAKHFTYYF